MFLSASSFIAVFLAMFLSSTAVQAATLSSPHSPDEQNEKTKNYVSLDDLGRPDRFYAELAARFKELSPNNPAAAIEIKLGRVFQKAGGLVLVDQAGDESILASRIVARDGSGVSNVTEFKVSPDESKALYSYVKNGTDMNNWYVVDLKSKQTIAGPFTVRYNTANWSSDSKSIYYTDWDNAIDLARGDRVTRNFRVDLSTLKQELVFQPRQKSPREIYAIDDFSSKGQHYLIAYRTQGSAVMPIAAYLGRKGRAKRGQFQVGKFAWSTIRHPKSKRLGIYLDVIGSKVYLRSSEAGNSFGIVAVDVARKLKTTTIVASRPDQILFNAQRASDYLLLQYFSTKTFEWTIEIANLSGKILKVFKLSDVGLPDVGTLGAFVAPKFGRIVYLSYNEMRVAPTTLKLDLSDALNFKLEQLASPSVIPFDGSRVKHERHWVASEDGTSVPIAVFTRTDVAKPTFGYLFYYGYIGAAQFSTWNRKLQVVLDMGGAVVIVNHRGGGELGVDWQLSVKTDRLPSLQDTVAAGRWMRKNLGVQKIVASGRSFGGMHTLGLLAHYPEEFDAFVPIASVSDIEDFLSHGKFGFFAVDDFGIQRDRFGNPKDTVAWRRRLAAWSPLKNVSKMKMLKPTMLFTADHDERVEASHTYEMADALNAKFPGNNSVFVYTEKNNGHFARSEFQDEMAFIGKIFGISALDPLK